jgi:outer membrane protein assembly factor BamE
MQKLINLLVFAMLALTLAGCHVVYTPDVQQGNLFDKTINQKAMDQLKPGLTKTQVLSLLGTPSVSSPFGHDRWDYVSTFSHRGGKMKINTMSLYFNNDTLVRTEGSIFSQDAQELVKDSKKYHASYPVNETQGDKSKNPKDKDDGGFDPGKNDGH